ncbi:MAG: MFS transporter [Bdellovibrionaceae bacterium]|nr:MFS transporter [Pseudobdellovibrionaceae bacterium]
MKTKNSLIAIFIVILTDITGFGMVIPLTPILARDFGAEGLKIGLLISCYSVVQFLFAPFWGRLSDIFGRKNVILVGLFGSSLAHLLFAFSTDFNDIFISRLLAGFFGGNVVIATAYIADLTSQQNRSKNLGLIGMAFGAGFTIGPLLGFLFILLGSQLGSVPPFGAHFASMGASLVCFINFILSSLFLKESLSERRNISKIFQRDSSFNRPSFYLLWESLKSPKLGRILIMSFILWVSLAQIEPVLILLVQDDFSWDKKTAYSSFIYIGILMILSQGYLVRKWIPKWGESLVNRIGLLSMSIGLLAIAFAGFIVSSSSAFLSLPFFILLIGVTGFSIGYSLSNTSLNGALSLMTSKKQQGSIFGINQSLSSMGRIIGPVVGGWCYQHLNHESPFILAGALSLGAFVIAVLSKKTFPNKGKTI